MRTMARMLRTVADRIDHAGAPKRMATLMSADERAARDAALAEAVARASDDPAQRTGETL